MRIVGLDMLKKLGVLLIGLVVGVALLDRFLSACPGLGPALLIAFLCASPVAYAIRQATRRKEPRHERHGRAERMPLQPGAFHHEEEP